MPTLTVALLVSKNSRKDLNQVFSGIEYSRGKIALPQGYFSGS
jgi:hypothetical protein